ncbi:MAG: [FeFe] hydrogenase H-cluster radical SAM maturase HydG [Candidatus Omnitrophica bacterium]|nr:[FeFe] hydrogenase H-cluster radical SAM maturase HydG [Candidatus Omnitrophota bacterium]
MRYINERKIEDLLAAAAKVDGAKIEAILEKSRALKRLTLEESAALLTVEEPRDLEKIFTAASWVKDKIYGKRIVLFAPLYISNLCVNGCLYCAFKRDNPLIQRKTLTLAEISEQVEWLLKRGHKRILLVAAELASSCQAIDYYVEAIKTIYRTRFGPHYIRRVNINCAPLSVEGFKRLKAAGIGTYQLFQETYHEKTYRDVHPAGPKSDPDNRLEAIDRAFSAGIDDVGIGVLYGLYDYKFETLALLMHIEHLEERFGVGPHTISVPRIEPALGAELSQNIPYPVSDLDFKKIVAVLRLSVPYTGMILSTRERPALRDELVNLGISQISAESRTSPGGYTENNSQNLEEAQFSLSDQRNLEEIIAALLDKGLIPSFCAACYRKERTGETFMNLAKPGLIKEKCSVNALITLKEYLDDFASSKVKESGYRLIDEIRPTLSPQDQQILKNYFASIDQGARDKYI